MFNLIKNLFGKNNPALQEALSQGATVIDVRTPQEYAGGNRAKSVNIPLDQIEKQMDKIKKLKQPIVACCASGMRSATACNILRRHGIQAVNGGRYDSFIS